MHIKGLDGIRGLSALSVVVTHLHGWAFLQERGLLSPYLTPMVDGSAGVQAFFVLSGFLITTLLIKELEITGTISLKNFLVRRALRIFPLYYLLLVAATLLWWLDRRIATGESLAYGYFYVYNFVPKSAYTSFMGHTWSLAVEEHFYLLWPFTFLVLFARSQRVVLLFLLAAVPAAMALHLFLVREGLGYRFFVERWTFVAGYSIAIGAILAVLLARVDRNSSWRQPPRVRLTCLAAVLLYLAPMLVYGHSWAFDNIAAPALRCTGIALFIAFVCFDQTTLAVKALEWPPLRYLGKVSYGIYMYQGLLLATGPARIEGHLWPPSPLVGIAFLVIAVPLSYHFFEAPLIRYKRNFGAAEVRRRTL